MKVSSNFPYYVGQLMAVSDAMSGQSNKVELSDDMVDALFYLAFSAKHHAEAIMHELRPEECE